jgi:hypothetical protein
MGKLVGRILPALRVVQLRSGSPDVAHDARDGSGDHEYCVDAGGPAGGVMRWLLKRPLSMAQNGIGRLILTS